MGDRTNAGWRFTNPPLAEHRQPARKVNSSKPSEKPFEARRLGPGSTEQATGFSSRATTLGTVGGWFRGNERQEAVANALHEAKQLSPKQQQPGWFQAEQQRSPEEARSQRRINELEAALESRTRECHSAQQTGKDMVTVAMMESECQLRGAFAIQLFLSKCRVRRCCVAFTEWKVILFKEIPELQMANHQMSSMRWQMELCAAGLICGVLSRMWRQCVMNVVQVFRVRTAQHAADMLRQMELGLGRPSDQLSTSTILQHVQVSYHLYCCLLTNCLHCLLPIDTLRHCLLLHSRTHCTVSCVTPATVALLAALLLPQLHC